MAHMMQSGLCESQPKLHTQDRVGHVTLSLLKRLLKVLVPMLVTFTARRECPPEASYRV